MFNLFVPSMYTVPSMCASGVVPSTGLASVFFGSFTMVMFNFFLREKGVNCKRPGPSIPGKC